MNDNGSRLRILRKKGEDEQDRTRLSTVLLLLTAGFTIAISYVLLAKPEIAYIPSKDRVLPYKQVSRQQFLQQHGETIHPDMFELGREVFYRETFGNEVFLTDIMGILDGPLTAANIMKAIIALRGEGTTNLRVELAETVTIGDTTYKKGTKIDTGLDVPRGAYVPLGMPVTFSNGRIKAGISCAACHATVDPHTNKVVEGAPNADLNAGLLMALATNSTAYFTHTDVKSLQKYLDSDRVITASDGSKQYLPDPYKLEREVDRHLHQWPRGNFDSTIDMNNNPAQIPDSFTLGDHPYGWSGFAMAGPFRGLTVFSNNVHAQNADSLTQADASPALFDIDKEVYLGTILQNAAHPRYRYQPNAEQKPSQFFRKVDPTPGQPGVNEVVTSPTYPRVSLMAPDGVIASSPGFHVNEQNNAVAAMQNRLNPPKPERKWGAAKVRRGREVFQRAGCITCHAGEKLSNNRVMDVEQIGTEPSRAKALKKTGKIFAPPLVQSPFTPVPIPEKFATWRAPTDELDPEEIKRAYAHGDSKGGYKVKGLVGLYWSAPYLHDGGVAVGPDREKDLGIAGTLQKGVIPDPANSLLALIDRDLRQSVIEANRQDASLRATRVRGIGHTYWVDEETGFSREDQQALIEYLLAVPYDKEIIEDSVKPNR